MSTRTRMPARRRALGAAGATVVLALTLTACGSATGAGPHGSSVPGANHGVMPSMSAGAAGSASGLPSSTRTSPTNGANGMNDMPGMPGTTPAAGGNGLADHRNGYRLSSAMGTLPSGRPAAYRFTVDGPDGDPVTHFALDQTKRMHFYAIRADLTGFQHLHPVMAADGTWTAHLAALTPGTWRLFASFTPEGGAGDGHGSGHGSGAGDGHGSGMAYVLSRTVTVPGQGAPVPLPAPAGSAQADGYTVAVAGDLTAGAEGPLTVTVTEDGKPVTDLQPYLGTYAHLTGFHQGDAAFAHLHPVTEAAGEGDHGGPALAFHAELPTAGDWRMFLQFRTGGTLHTAALTLRVG